MSSSVPIQIITPKDGKFELQLESVKRILEADEIKDRNVVVISVAGAFRKGKSFLLNFFLKYLNAQYKKHDLTDWWSATIAGFEFAGGRKPKTSGIWMWSEVFTHDFENGEKVAIILLDTQGIFDHRTSLLGNTTVFSLSIMLSSVQCYNVMQHIQEDDFQNLELFTEYGRLALRLSNEIPFQKLLFIVRDWPNPTEIPYGDGQSYIDELLTENPGQDKQMKKLRRRLQSSFDTIGAYLMPFPGSAVANGTIIHDNLSEIDPEFVVELKRLIPSILAPNNLILKKINGQKIRAREFVTYLQTYMSVFNNEETPNPNTILVGTALASIISLLKECLDLYADIMQKSIDDRSLNEDRPYFDQLELKLIHDDAKAKVISQFQERRLLGGDEFIQSFQNKLIVDIEVKYKRFTEVNEEKEKGTKAIAKANIQVLYMDCLKFYVDSIQKSLREVESFLSHSEFQQTHENIKRETLSKFEAQQIRGADAELIQTAKQKLENEIGTNYTNFAEENQRKRNFIEDLQSKTKEAASRAINEAKAEQMQKVLAEARADTKNLELYNDCLNRYINAMRSQLIENDSFYSKSHLDQIHENTKNDFLSKFKAKRDDDGRDKMLEIRLEHTIDMNYVQFSYENDAKRRDFQEKEELRNSNQQLQNQLKEVSSNSEDSNIFSGFLKIFTSLFASLFM